MKAQKKSETVLFRVTPAERKKLSRAARKKNMTPSEFLRWLLSQADAA